MNSKQRRHLTRKAPVGGEFTREFRLASDVDAEARTVSASLSSTMPVRRAFGDEVLSHELGAVDMSRAEGGLPLLFGHDHESPIGIVEDIRVDGDRLRGQLRFSRSARGDEVFRDVQDGILRSMSIGYQVAEWSEDKKSRTKTAIKWMPFEASVVSVPADHSVGVSRAKEDTTVSDDNEGREASTEVTNVVRVADYEDARKAALSEGVVMGRKLEQERTDGIRRTFAMFGTDPRAREIESECITRGTSVEDSKTALLEVLGSGAMPTRALDTSVDSEVPTRVQRGADALDKTARGLEQAIMMRAGMLKEQSEMDEVRASGFAGLSLVEMAREWCRVANVELAGDKRQLVGRAFTRAVSHGTSDFTSVLANITTKSLLMGYNEAPETWASWCKIGSLPDFKQAYRVQMSAFGDLDQIAENAEYKYGTYADHHEPITLLTYGKAFSISRQAILNDDVSAFSATATGMGRAAARKVGDLAYAVLTDNATLTQDGVALFDAATHGNLVTSGAIPSVATLNTAYAAMATQTDPSGATLNVTPQIIVAAHKLRGTIMQLLASDIVPATTASSGANIWRSSLTPVFDARLDANASGNPWFLMAAPSTFDTVEVAFLDGQQTPYLEEKEGWSVDGAEYKVRIDAAAKALDYRGMYQNDGLT